LRFNVNRKKGGTPGSERDASQVNSRPRNPRSRRIRHLHEKNAFVRDAREKN